MSIQYISECSAQAVKYVAHLLRGIQIARLNSQIASSGAASLLCLPDDILLMILDILEQDDESSRSDFKHLTMCNKRLRSLAWPSLFQQIHLGPSWSPERMVCSLKLLQHTEEALRAARKLHVDLWPGPTQMVASEILEELGTLLVDCMSRMDRLDSLSLSTTLACSDALRTAFDNANVEFPQVRELTAGYHLDWLIQYCPNLETLSSDDWLANCTNADEEPGFIEAAGDLPGLRSFSFNTHWDAALIEEVDRRMPQLRSLGIRGRIDRTLEEMLLAARKFRNLRTLALPDAGNLSGLDLSKCDPDHSYDISSAQIVAATTVFTTLPRLEEVQLGRCFRAWTTRDTHHFDRVSIQWEAMVGVKGQTWSRHTQSHCHHELGHIHLGQDDMRSLHRLDDDIASMLSGMDDSASIFSRPDTLAF